MYAIVLMALAFGMLSSTIVNAAPGEVLPDATDPGTGGGCGSTFIRDWTENDCELDREYTVTRDVTVTVCAGVDPILEGCVEVTVHECKDVEKYACERKVYARFRDDCTGEEYDAEGRSIATLQGEPLMPVVPGWHRVPFRAGGTVPESMDRIRWEPISEPAELEPVFIPIESLVDTARPPGIGGVVADVTGTVTMPEEPALQRVVVAVTLLDETGVPVAVDTSRATGLEPGGSHSFTFSLPKLSPVDQLVYDLEFVAVGWLPEEAVP